MRRPDPDDTVTEQQVVGYWRRVAGDATECYAADHSWATRRAAGQASTGVGHSTGTWRFVDGRQVELTVDRQTNRYAMQWLGHDRVTFLAADATEMFVRAEGSSP
ncbi:MAG: hypothetical protein AB7S26_00780 [Sandaracinaceae bacterium]